MGPVSFWETCLSESVVINCWRDSAWGNECNWNCWIAPYLVVSQCAGLSGVWTSLSWTCDGNTNISASSILQGERAAISTHSSIQFIWRCTFLDPVINRKILKDTETIGRNLTTANCVYVYNEVKYRQFCFYCLSLTLPSLRTSYIVHDNLLTLYPTKCLKTSADSVLSGQGYCTSGGGIEDDIMTIIGETVRNW